MKIWKHFAAVAAILGIIAGFAACKNDTTHVHQWGEWTVTTPATCTTAGEETRVCALDPTHAETRPVAALGIEHTPNTETGTCTVCGSLTYNIGDTGPGGGKIFYAVPLGFTLYMDAVDTSGTTAHYLEAAPNDNGGGSWASSGYANTDIPGTGTAIGTGRKNTAIILATDVNASAAKICSQYNNNGKTDWFLPSKDELNELYKNRAAV